MKSSDEKELEQKLSPLNERCCGFQETLLFMRENYPNAALMTYNNVKHEYAHQIMLAKIIPGVNIDNDIIWGEEADFCQTDNHLGWLKSVSKIAGYEIEIEFLPLICGQKNLEWEGMALFKVNCSAQIDITIRFGGSGETFMHHYPVKEMLGNDLDLKGCKAQKMDDYLLLENDRSPLFITANSSGTIQLCQSQYGETIFKNGQGWLMFAFSQNKKRAIQLIENDPVKKEMEIKNHYQTLLNNWELNTPNQNLNEAFQHALINMEMSWFKPYGWIESIHHWPTFWHMEHTVAAEWSGQQDRVKKCLQTHIDKQFPSGAIPHLCPTGDARRDWGGTNHFFFRQVNHYYKMTGDIEFLKSAETAMEKALKQTIKEYDPENSGLLKWSTQIGNQEDFESTPGGGTAPTCELINMFNTMALVKKELNKLEQAKKYINLAQKSINKLYSVLWQKDLGRFAWYQDDLDYIRPEGAYHTITSPVIYGLLDYVDAYTSLTHLRDRLSGPEGEIYLSNHFADHDEDGHATWGMQPGSNMQAFGTLAFAEMNFKEEAVKPLEFIAKRVCGDYQRGSWPETANEKRFAYFSPSAAVYIQGIIEGIFGLKLNIPEETIEVAPCIPEDWDQEIELSVSNLNMKYLQQENKITIKLDTEKSLNRIFKISLPFSEEIMVKVDGFKVPFDIYSKGNKQEVVVKLNSGNQTKFELFFNPVDYKVEFPETVVSGEDIQLTVESETDIKIGGIEDRGKILEKINYIDEKTIQTCVTDDLLLPYKKYGWLGLMNFSRRTFFVELEIAGEKILYPCTVTVTPDLIFYNSKLNFDENNVKIKVVNNSNQVVSENIILELANSLISTNSCIPIGESTLIFEGIEDIKDKLSPGFNKGKIYLANGQQYDIKVDANSINKEKIKQINLPQKLLKSRDVWQKLRSNYSSGHYLGSNSDYVLNEDLKDNTDILLPGVKMKLENGLIPISHQNQAVVEIDLSMKAKKLYIMTACFADNHDIYSKIARFDVYTKDNDAYKEAVFTKTLCYPGDLDSAYALPYAKFATYQEKRNLEKIPDIFRKNNGDYLLAQPPEFPEPEYWTNTRTDEIHGVVVNLIEFDFSRYYELDKLKISALESDAALAVLSISAHVE